MVALGEASMATWPAQAIISGDAGEVNMPAPKNPLLKLARKDGRSILSPSMISSNTPASTPSGWSGVFSIIGVTAEIRTAWEIRSLPCRDR